MDIEEAVVGGRSEGEEACPSPHGLTQGSPTRDDEPDMGIRKLMKKQPSMQRSSRGRGSVKRPSLLDVFRGSHWDRALGQSRLPRQPMTLMCLLEVTMSSMGGLICSNTILRLISRLLHS